MRESMHTRKKKSLSCYGKALFSYGLIVALLFLPQAAWATIPDGTASGDNAIAIGKDSKADGKNSIAIAIGAGAYGENSIAIGNGAYVNSKDGGGVAIGAGAKVTEGDSVAIGSGSIALEADIVSVGNSESGLYRKITNVAQGTISDTSAEAITGKQVYNVIGDVIDSFLGKGVWGNDGTYTFSDGRFSVKFSVGGQTYDSVQDALDAVAAGVGTGAYNAVQYDDSSKTRITLNEGGEATQLTNVADGTIAEGSTDAVTGGQLFTTNNRVTAAEEQIATLSDNAIKYDDSDKTKITLNKGGEATQLTNVADGRIAAGSRDAVTGNQLYQAYQRMNDLDRSIDVVGAHAAAMSALHPVPYNKYEPTTFSAGVGTYHDECAMAIGAFHYIRPNLMVNVGASVCSDGDVMGRIGLSIALGKSTKKQPELAHDVAGMQEQMSVMQAKLTELEEQNRRDKEIIQKNAEIMAQNERIITELMQKSANK